MCANKDRGPEMKVVSLVWTGLTLQVAGSVSCLLGYLVGSCLQIQHSGKEPLRNFCVVLLRVFRTMGDVQYFSRTTSVQCRVAIRIVKNVQCCGGKSYALWLLSPPY